MSKKKQNQQKQHLKKLQKEKKRQQKLKQQKSPKQTSFQSMEDLVDYALELFDNGEHKKSKKLLESLQKKEPMDSHVNYALGIHAVFFKDFDGAILFFEKAIQANPNFMQAHFNLGMCYKTTFRLNKMIEAFRNSLKCDNGNEKAFKIAKEMIENFEKQVQEDEGITLDEHLQAYNLFEQGSELMRVGSWEEAIVCLKKSAMISLTHPQTFGNMGICYMQLGEKAEALKAFDKALEIDPQYEPAMLNRELARKNQEGEKANLEVKVVDYNLDYGSQKGALIRDYLNSKLGSSQ